MSIYPDGRGSPAWSASPRRPRTVAWPCCSDDGERAPTAPRFPRTPRPDRPRCAGKTTVPAVWRWCADGYAGRRGRKGPHPAPVPGTRRSWRAGQSWRDRRTAAGERRHHDPFTVRSGKVAGEAALPAVADPDVRHAGGWGLAEESQVASDGSGGVLRCCQPRRVTGHEPWRRWSRAASEMATAPVRPASGPVPALGKIRVAFDGAAFARIPCSPCSAG